MTLQEGSDVLVASYAVLEKTNNQFSGDKVAKEAELIATFCTKFQNDFGSSSGGGIVSPTTQSDISFTYPDDGITEFDLQAFVTSSNVLWFCENIAVTSGVTYTLQLVSPTSGNIQNDIANDPFAFDASTLKLTISGTN